jgi:hypothetical protein
VPWSWLFGLCRIQAVSRAPDSVSDLLLPVGVQLAKHSVLAACCALYLGDRKSRAILLCCTHSLCFASLVSCEALRQFGLPVRKLLLELHPSIHGILHSHFIV